MRLNKHGIRILSRIPVHKPFDQAEPRDPRRQCFGKFRHRNRDSALAHARAAGPEFRSYCCPHCHRFHVGHSEETLVMSVKVPPCES